MSAVLMFTGYYCSICTKNVTCIVNFTISLVGFSESGNYELTSKDVISTDCKAPSFPTQMGNGLVSAGHYRSEEVRDSVQTLTQDWKTLTAASAEKGYHTQL